METPTMLNWKKHDTATMVTPNVATGDHHRALLKLMRQVFAQVLSKVPKWVKWIDTRCHVMQSISSRFLLNLQASSFRTSPWYPHHSVDKLLLIHYKSAKIIAPSILNPSRLKLLFLCLSVDLSKRLATEARSSKGDGNGTMNFLRRPKTTSKMC